MLDNDTEVEVEGRQGKIKRKRKVPRSSPVAWEYEVEFADGKREWIGRYHVKTVGERGPRRRGTNGRSAYR